MFLGSHRAQTTSRVETSGLAALDVVRARCKGLAIINAEKSALVPLVTSRRMVRFQVAGLRTYTN